MEDALKKELTKEQIISSLEAQINQFCMTWNTLIYH